MVSTDALKRSLPGLLAMACGAAVLALLVFLSEAITDVVSQAPEAGEERVRVFRNADHDRTDTPELVRVQMRPRHGNVL